MRWPTSAAITWSMETPARMSVALLFRRTPVRNVPLPRAWSPAPSGPGFGRLVVEAAEDLDQALERLQRLEGPARAGSRPPRRSATRRPGWRRWGSRRTPSAAARPWRSWPGAPAPVGGQQPGRAQRRERRQRDRRRRAPRRKWRRLRPSGRREADRVESRGHASGPYAVGSDARPAPRSERSAVSVVIDRRRFWNGADSMMPAIRAEARPSVRLEPLDDRVDGLRRRSDSRPRPRA